MKLNRILMAILLAIVCLTVVVWAQPSQTRNTRWEYLTVLYEGDDKINALANNQGWELAFIQVHQSGTVFYVMKRQR